MATRLVSRIRTTLGVELAIRTLFEFPTVGELGPRLRESVEEGRSPLAAEKRPEKLPLSHAQQRLWFIDRLEGTSAEYNMTFALRLKGELDRTALERALDAIVERHESLRTRFVEVEGEPFQVIEPDCRIELALEDMSGREESAQQERVQEALRSEAGMPFDLMRGPVLRVKLLRLGAEDHVLLRTMHHIVSDGWSEGVFNHELMVLYEAFVEGRENPLRPLRVQYADFALWQRRWLEGGALERGLSYWKEQLAGIPTRLELPADRARPALQTFGGDQVNRHDDFFRLGGHSLLTLRMVTLLQQRGFIITVSDIFANPTIKSLAAKLKTRERSDSADIAIQINGGNADRPLFLTHCGNGELLYASALAPHIDRNIPLYGLPAMPADQAQPETIEEMATRMVRMIRSLQPAGPYRIAGWSGGGIVAYEIATQLIGAHEQVEFIAMFDTLYPRLSARRARIDFHDSAFLLDLIESAGTERNGQKAALDSIRASLHTMDFADVVQECDRLSLIPDTLRYLTVAQTRLKLARTHSLFVAVARYQPHPLHIPVHFFPALDAQDSGNSCPHRGWNEVVPSDLLRITPVPGSHHSMLRSPNVELLGQSLTQAICQMAQ